MQPFTGNPADQQEREDRSTITPWKGKDAELFLEAQLELERSCDPPPSPLPHSEASWAPLTPWERGTDFQGLVSLESTASAHLEDITLLLPEGETRGNDDGRGVFWPSCVCFTENDLIALFCES